MTDDWEPLAAKLAETVTDGIDPGWREVFATTPRHRYVPRFWALDEYNCPDELVEASDPRRLVEVYSDQLLVTQWQPKDGLRMVSSSASQPSLVAWMLHVADIQPGHRVLEIGTGTGYNTALLCRRGAEVTTVDIDPVLVAEAAGRLRADGHTPNLAAGDGVLGMIDHAPYDRIISTCAAATVPAAWIDQLADGGRLVAPLTVGGALAVLHKTGPDEVMGMLDRKQAYFMPLHPAGQPQPPGLVTTIPTSSGPSHIATTDVPHDVWSDPEFRLWLALHAPWVNFADSFDDTTGTHVGVIVFTADRWARVGYRAGHGSVVQDQTRLFDTIETAWAGWCRHGRPGRTRIGITAHRGGGGQHAWLDHRHGPMRWPLTGVSQVRWAF